MVSYFVLWIFQNPFFEAMNSEDESENDEEKDEMMNEKAQVESSSSSSEEEEEEEEESTPSRPMGGYYTGRVPSSSITNYSNAITPTTFIPPIITPIPVAPLLMAGRYSLNEQGLTNYEVMEIHRKKLYDIKEERRKLMIEAKDVYQASQHSRQDYDSATLKCISDRYFWWLHAFNQASFAWKTYIEKMNGRPVSTLDMDNDVSIDLTSLPENETKNKRKKEGGNDEEQVVPKKPKTAKEMVQDMTRAFEDTYNENEKLKRDMERMKVQMEGMKREMDNLKEASVGKLWSSEGNVKNVIKVMEALTGQVFKHMECPLSSNIIKNAVFVKGHFYEKEEMAKLMNSAYPKDPFDQRQSIYSNDVIPGIWYNGLYNNIKHLIAPPPEDGVGTSIVDGILQAYLDTPSGDREKVRKMGV